MAQQSSVLGIFGMSPEMYQQQRRDLMEAEQLAEARQFAGPGSMLNPSLGPLYAEAAQQGQMIGQGVKGLLGVEDPQLQMIREVEQLRKNFDVGTPQGLKAFASALAPKYPELAIQAAAKAADIDKDIAAAQKSRREAIPTPQNAAEAAKLNALLAQYPDTIEGRAKAADAFATWKSEFKQKEAAAGVPQPGMVGISDLKGAKAIVDDYTKAPREKLKAVGEIGVLINQISTNPTALPQLQRSLVKLAGDSQIGQNEVKNILGSSGFTADVIDGVNKFLTGAPTNAKLQDVARGVKAIEQFYANQYEQGRETSKRVLSNAKLDERTISDLIPSAYNTGRSVPSLNEWLAAAKRANPKATDAELTQYYNNKYAK